MSRVIHRIRVVLTKMLLTRRGYIIGRDFTFGRGTVFWAPNEIKIGDDCYIGKYCTVEADLDMGNDVLVGNNVGFLGKYDHDYSIVGRTIRKAPSIRDSDYAFKGAGSRIVVENDVWIGYGSILLSGITVHRGAIVAAGSVVTHDVEPYAIFAGNPAKKIAMRFSPSQVEEHERLLRGRADG